MTRMIRVIMMIRVTRMAMMTRMTRMAMMTRVTECEWYDLRMTGLLRFLG